MDIRRLRMGLGGKASHPLWMMMRWRTRSQNARILGPPSCSKQQPQPNGANNNGGDKVPSDWDKAWSSFRKRGKKTLFSPNKYVTWNPKFSNYPLSEEVDPIKRAERSSLMFWTGPRFTLVGAIVIVTFLLIYTILSPVK